jgi:hypothetical protein
MLNATFGKGEVPGMGEPCMEKIRIVNGTETADGTSMIPAKSQK